MMIKEYRCEKHGPFEASHPICNAPGCDSSHVKREIRTAPKVKSENTTRTDAGLAQTARSYGLTNMRTAREGETTKVTRPSNEVIWGLDNAQKKLGFQTPDSMLHKPKTYTKTDQVTGKVERFVDHGGLPATAELVGNMDLFKSKVETTISKEDAQLRKQVGR